MSAASAYSDAAGDDAGTCAGTCTGTCASIPAGVLAQMLAHRAGTLAIGTIGTLSASEDAGTNAGTPIWERASIATDVLAHDAGTRANISTAMPSASTNAGTRTGERASIPNGVLAQVEGVLARAGTNAGTPTRERASIAGTAWRIEVTRNGRYWQWRRGRGADRESRYGGKFATLDPARQAAYWQNRERYHARNGTRNPATSPLGVPERRGQAGTGVPAQLSRDAHPATGHALLSPVWAFEHRNTMPPLPPAPRIP